MVYEPLNPAGTPVHRLHPTSVVFGLAGIIRSLLIPLIIVALVSGASRDVNYYFWIFGILSIPGIGFEVIRYIVTRIRFEGGEIIINRGLLFRSERHIPYHRIQNIDLVQNIFHRLCRVAVVKIETGSGGDAEAELKVLSLATVDAMRERVFADRPDKAAALAEQIESADTADQGDVGTAGDGGGTTEGAGGEEELVRLTTRDLVQVGLITNRGLALVAVAFGLSMEANIWEWQIWERFEQLEPFIDRMETVFKSSILATAGLVLVIVALLYTLSIIWSIMRFHGFRLTRRGQDLRITCGLFTRVGATVPRPRVQFLTVRETLLHRLFKRASIRIETAGGNVKDDETTLLSRRWFVPIIPSGEVEQLIERVQPDYSLRDADWQPLAPMARRRKIRRAMILMTMIGAVLMIWLPWQWGTAAWLVLMALGTAHAWRQVAVTRWAETGHGIAFRTGVLTRNTSITLFSRVQTAGIDQTPFDRRWDMATLDVDTAGAGTAGHRISIRDLPREIADRLRMTISAKAEAAGFRWT